MKTLLPALLAAACTLGAAQAQTPAAAPAAEGRTLSLGGSGKGPLLDRDELRACLKQQESLTARRNEVEQQREPLERDKAQLAQDQEALAAERSRVDASRRSVEELGVRLKAYSDRVAAWNQRARAAQERSGPGVEGERRQLDNDRAQLQKEQAALEAERAAVGTSAQQAVADYNAKAQALDARVKDWNRRNAELSDLAVAVNLERERWVDECANRRYREDDEIAIRNGK